MIVSLYPRMTSLLIKFLPPLRHTTTVVVRLS